MSGHIPDNTSNSVFIMTGAMVLITIDMLSGGDIVRSVIILGLLWCTKPETRKYSYPLDWL